MGRLIDVVVAQRRHGRYSDGSSAWYGSWEETRTIKIHRDKLSTNKIHLHETGPGSSGISGLHFHKYYTWENKYTGHQKVLFHIKWDDNWDHYYLNAGAFDHEEEILLRDGVRLIVRSVDVVTDKNGQMLHTLINLEKPY